MIYLNYAALSPTDPEAEQEVERTLTEFKHYLYSDAGIEWYLNKVRDCRQKVGSLLHVSDPSTIAFVSNASTAHFLILSSLNWKSGDTILTTTHENPSITSQLFALEPRGIHIHAIKPVSPGEFIKEFKHQVNQHHPKAIVMSHVSHVDGRVFPIHDISVIAKEHQCVVIIDGAQAVGHIPVDLSLLDFDVYLFTGHKWCRGPLGTGAMVVRDGFFQHPDYQQIQTEKPGWPSTSPFEIGTHNIGLIAGLAQACQLRHQKGIETEQLLNFQKETKEQLGRIQGCQVVEWEGPHAPGILTFKGKPDLDHVQFSKQLASEFGIIVKHFVDYPASDIPAIRLSWSSMLKREDFQKGLWTIGQQLQS